MLKDPLEYNEAKDLALIVVPKNIPSPSPLNELQAEAKCHELAGTIQPIDIPPLVNPDTKEFTRPRTRMPSFGECEVLGGLVAMGMPLESACSLLTPPLRFEKVDKCLRENFKRRTIYRRAQSKWLYNSLQLLLTRPSKEIGGLIFILKNRHSRLFDSGNRLKLDITSAGSPLQLTSPEVIARARIYANTPPVIDVDTIPMLTDAEDSGSYVDTNTLPTPTPSSSHMPNTTGINNTSFVSHNETIGENTSSRSPIFGDGGKSIDTDPPSIFDGGKSIDTDPPSIFHNPIGENTSRRSPIAGGSTNAFEDIMEKKPKIFENEEHRMNAEAYARRKAEKDAERARAYLESLLNNPEPESEEE